MNYNLFACCSVRHFGDELISGCETVDKFICRINYLHKTPYVIDECDKEYADLCNYLGIGA